MFSASMFTLPDLTPRDPHDIWYLSRHAPASVPHHLLINSTSSSNNNNNSHSPSAPHENTNNNNNNAALQQLNPRERDHRRAMVERTALARLRHDEALMERRRANVSNYGSGWLKPPGVPKTLFQMREERREAEEHAEAMRREAQMQAQMAEAGLGEDEQMLEDGEGEQDLDEDIPEGEGFGFDGEDSVEGEEGDEDEEETVEGSEGEDHAGAVSLSPAQEEEVRDLRAAEDRVREMIARGHEQDYDTSDFFAGSGDREQMLEEDDLEPAQQDAPDMNADISMAMDMDMDADLDEGVPEGGDGDDLYEHTDSDEEVSEDGTRDISFAGRSSVGVRPHGSRLRRSMPRSSMRSSNRASLAQSDVDISGLLSGDGSSFLDSSPQMRRRG